MRLVSMANRLPAIFFGHGNPMNALAHNAYTEAWAGIGASIPRPRAVLSISAHWYVSGLWALPSQPRRAPSTTSAAFRPSYTRCEYPAPGDPELARRVQQLLAPVEVSLDERWGLDHGTWSVLCHVYPQADIPVVQLSIDETMNRPSSTTKSGDAWRRCATRAC